ncbi:MAG: heavy metal-binding domain-containing protein, partial [Flavobacterium sp.]|uniref:heavy metal-binding domain-containing protein n=1 Tax=Flavobacterium sp. TaxID=239 RepID=UPI0026063C3A
MKNTYTITGMSCNVCRTKVEKALNAIEGVDATVTLDPPIATIHTEKSVSIFKLQKALYTAGNYIISESDATSENSLYSTPIPSEMNQVVLPISASGKYYCPMFCEGEKVYDKAGDCPVCGMDLIKAPDLNVSKTS